MVRGRERERKDEPICCISCHYNKILKERELDSRRNEPLLLVVQCRVLTLETMYTPPIKMDSAYRISMYL